MTNVIRFDGSIPRHYEDYLTGFVFNAFAADLVSRILLTTHHILELAAGSDVLGAFLDPNPMLQDPGPFSLDEHNTIKLLDEAGFSNTKATTLNKIGTIESAAMAAKGFIEGLPVSQAIWKNDPSMLPKAVHQLEQELIQNLGDHPLRSPLQAFVFKTSKS